VESQLPKGRAAVAKAQASGCKPWRAQQAETELGPGDWDIEEHRVIGGSGPTQGAEILAGHRDWSDRWPASAPATRPGRAQQPPRAGARASARAAPVAKSVESQLPKGRAAVAKAQASGCRPRAQQAETELGPGDWDIEGDHGSESTKADSSDCQSDLSMSEKHSGDASKRSDVSSDCSEGTTRARPRAKVIVSL